MKVVGFRAAARELRRLGMNMPKVLDREVQRAADRLANRVRSKLADDVLQRQTGRLWRSVTTDKPGEGQREVGTNVKYAAIHEFGGIIPAHFVRPVRKQALSWEVGGIRYFSRGHMIPDVRIPKRPYMRPSMEEVRPEIVAHARQRITTILAEAARRQRSGSGHD